MIGVVSGDEPVGELRDRLEAAGSDVLSGDARTVVGAGPSAVVARGAAALVDLVSEGLEAPVLLVESPDVLHSVPLSDAHATLDRLAAGRYRTRHHRLLDVRTGDRLIGTAVFDVMLVVTEPGRISEYRLSGDGTDFRVRADGVVVATPAGSHGYAHAAGGPRLSPELDAVAVVPVAAFGLGAPQWVLDPSGGLELGVERDEVDVSILLDGRDRDRLRGRSAVGVEPGSPLRVIVPGEP